MTRIPSELLDQWHFLDKCALEIFSCTYWNLSNNKRLAVHLAINDAALPVHQQLVDARLLTNMPGIHNGSYGGYPIHPGKRNVVTA